MLATWVAASRHRRFDAVLAHNVEAAAVALAARPMTRTPVVYVAHTLLRHELSAYGRAGGPLVDRLGAAVDRGLARRADAVLALCEAARRALAPHARGPVARIPPGLDVAPPPGPDACAGVCARHGLGEGAFALYAGNLDGYQDLAVLAAAGRRAGPHAWPIVLATHQAVPADATLAPLRVITTPDPEEVRALAFAAGALVLPRARPGGFPIKLLNYLETGRPVVARRGLADGLEADRHALLLADDAGPEAFAGALEALREDPARAASLGRAGRRHLEDAHAWGPLAERTLALVDAAGAASLRRRAPGR